MNGMNAEAARVRVPFMPAMNTVLITMRSIILAKEVSCTETKFFTVSTSEVQRCNMSPV